MPPRHSGRASASLGSVASQGPGFVLKLAVPASAPLEVPALVLRLAGGRPLRRVGSVGNVLDPSL